MDIDIVTRGHITPAYATRAMHAERTSPMLYDLKLPTGITFYRRPEKVRNTRRRSTMHRRTLQGYQLHLMNMPLYAFRNSEARQELQITSHKDATDS